VSADVSDLEVAATIVFDAATTLGPVSVLINCAAVFEERDLANVDVAHCEQHFRINTLAPVFLSKAFVSQLPADRAGHIINLLDWRATRAPKTHLVYSASKAALANATKTLAQQLAPRIQVNGIAPGAILPPPDQPDWHDQRARTSVPLQRPGCPQDISDAVAYLLRSSFVTGEILHVAGGEQL
jgi:NAD(P)-dependent dehydrogenase (short-subunit alcohol dehydrogenase family)